MIILAILAVCASGAAAAIPYKFIRISPKSQGEFLIESAGDNASMPPSSGR